MLSRQPSPISTPTQPTPSQNIQLPPILKGKLPIDTRNESNLSNGSGKHKVQVIVGLSDLSLDFSNFSPPLWERSMITWLIIISKPMGKRMAVARCRSSARLSTEADVALPALTHGRLQLAETLRELHGCAGNGSGQQPAVFVRQMQSSVVDFLWRRKKYTNCELDDQLANFAHLLHLLPNFAGNLRPNPEFTRKLLRVLGWLSQPVQPHSPHHHNQTKIVFYILAALTTPSYMQSGSCGRWLNRSRAVVRGVLNAVVPLNREVHELYGVLLTRISTLRLGRPTKTLLVRRTVGHLRRFQKGRTALNMLTYLRAEKNKVSINPQDVNQGGLVQWLTDSYSTFLKDYRSYFILDYLRHLLTIFPSLCSQAASSKFVSDLVSYAQPPYLHHPMHKSAIDEVLRLIISGLERDEVDCFLKNLTSSVNLRNTNTAILVGRLILHYSSSECAAELVFALDLFPSIIRAMLSAEPKNNQKDIQELLCRLVSKVASLNTQMAAHLTSTLRISLQAIPNSHLLQQLETIDFEQMNYH